MALFRYLLPKKQPTYILSVFRRYTGFVKSFSTHSTCLLSHTEISGSSFQNARKAQLANNDSVFSITNQVKDCLKGAITEGDVLDNYSRHKRDGGLSEGDLVRVLYRLAKTQQHQWKKKEEKMSNLFKSLLDDISDKRDQLKPFQIADVLWSLGKLGSFQSKLFGKFESIIESIEDFSEFSNGDLAMILWAYGKANISAPVVFNIIRKEIDKRGFESFSTRDICQMLWACARVEKRTVKLFASVSITLEERDMTKFNNQDIIMLLWAFSEGGLNVRSLFRLFRNELLSSTRLAEYSARDLSVILWSFANRGLRAPELFAAVEKELLRRSKVNLDEQSLVMIAWSFAHTDNKSPSLFQFVEAEIASTNLAEWSLHRLVRIFWAFTKSGLLSVKVCNSITSAMVGHDFSELSQSEIEEMVDILQYCKLKIPPRVVSLVEKELMKRAGETGN